MKKPDARNDCCKGEALLLTARELWVSGDYDQAERILFAILEKPNSNLLGVITRLELGHVAFEKEQYSKSLEHYKKALLWAEQLNFKPQRAWALVGLSNIAVRKGELNDALALATKALSLFQEPTDSEIALFEAKRLQAIYHLFVGEFSKSLEIMESVIVDLESQHKHDLLGKICLVRTLSALAGFHLYVGNLSSCSEICRKSYKIASEMTSRGYRQGMATAVNNVGEVHKARGNYKAALKHYEEALNLYLEVNAEGAAATALHNLGLIYSTRGEYQRATEYFERSLQLTEGKGSNLDLAVLFGDMAAHEHLRGNFGTARQLFEKSIKLYRAVGSEEELVEKLCRFSGTLVELGVLSQAEELLQEASALAKKHKSRSEYALCRYQLGVLENIRENFGQAQILFSEALAVAEEVGTFRLAIESRINLAELAMRRYRLTLDSTSFTTAMDHVRRSEALAEREGLHPVVVDTKMIISALLLARLEFKESLELLNEAINLSEEHDLPPRLRRALTQKAALENRQTSLTNSISQSEETRELAAEDAQRYMRIATQRSRTPAMPDFDPDSLFITLIKYSINAPEVLLSQDLPISDQDPEVLLLKMGVFFSAAISQGNLQHEGLFGPLPLTSNYSSLIYAVCLPDKAQIEDSRNGKSYTLFCLGYPNVFDPYFVDRDVIEAVFEDSLADLEDLSFITLEVLTTIKEGIAELASQGNELIHPV